MPQDEDDHIQENIGTVRTYLDEEFKGLKITDESYAPLVHIFTVFNEKEYKVFKLTVAMPRLADKGNSPEDILRRLQAEKIADKMRELEKGGFSWGR